MAASFEIKGAKAMQRKIERIARDFPNRVERALRVEAEVEVMTPAKKSIRGGEGVPVDIGPLRSSGHVKDVERRGKELSVAMGFGGPAGAGNLGETNKEYVGYAIIQHENPNFAHKVGSWKYLETPLMRAIPGMAQRIADEVKL
jgi:hypothetical protein